MIHNSSTVLLIRITGDQSSFYAWKIIYKPVKSTQVYTHDDRFEIYKVRDVRGAADRFARDWKCLVIPLLKLLSENIAKLIRISTILSNQDILFI